MATFTYEAVDNQGRQKNGQVDAANAKEAKEKVKAMGLFPTKDPVSKGGDPVRGIAAGKGATVIGRPKRKQVTLFTRQFSTLQDAGLPIVRCLDILEAQFRPGVMKSAIGSIREDVEGGAALSEAMAKHPRVWDGLYTSMIRAGEMGGVLPTILVRLADYREKSERLTRQIVGKMIYPAIVVVVAFVVVSIIMIFIVPQFVKMYESMNIGDLPWLTVLLKNVSAALATVPGVICLIGTPIALYLTWRAIGMNPKGRYALDKFKLSLPIFGELVKKTAVSRFCRTLGTLQGAGVPILDALRIIQGTAGNEVVAKAVEKVHASIREGDPIAEPLRHSGVFDDLVVNMIAVGEETGELEKMLNKIADTYDHDIDALVNDMMSVLEPILIVFMGVTVGFIVVALFLPMTTMIARLADGQK
jgi:type IV pilus assembly protein PilC